MNFEKNKELYWRRRGNDWLCRWGTRDEITFLRDSDLQFLGGTTNLVIVLGKDLNTIIRKPLNKLIEIRKTTLRRFVFCSNRAQTNPRDARNTFWIEIGWLWNGEPGQSTVIYYYYLSNWSALVYDSKNSTFLSDWVKPREDTCFSWLDWHCRKNYRGIGYIRLGLQSDR